MAWPFKWNLFGSTLYFHMVLFVFRHDFYKIKFGILSEGAFHKSELASRTMARPGIRDFKIQRRGPDKRERQKNNWFN